MTAMDGGNPGLTILIPARGGSKGVRRKNLQPVGDLPLVVHAIMAATEFGVSPTVLTDNEDISALAKAWGADVWWRENAPDEQTIAELLEEVVPHMVSAGNDHIMVIQPTSIVDAIHLEEVWELHLANHIEGLALHTTTANHETKLGLCREGHPLSERVNRQAGDATTVENGAVRIFAPGTHFDMPPHQYAHQDHIDIDTWGDLAKVRSTHEPAFIGFRFHASKEKGAGHLRRCLVIAEALQGHQIEFYPDASTEEWAMDHLKGFRVNYRDVQSRSWGRGLLINDTLDTSDDAMLHLRQLWDHVITFEDRGSGAPLASLAINALYPQGYPNEVGGADWAILPPEFAYLPRNRGVRATHGSRVLLSFGGTDPSMFTERTFRLLANVPEDLDVKAMPGFSNAHTGIKAHLWSGSMVEALRWADLVVTSAGRTVYEAAAAGTPAVVMAANLRESHHAHLGVEYGNIYLGLGDLVLRDQLVLTVISLLGSSNLRAAMVEHGYRTIDGKGLKRVVRKVEDILEGL